MSDVIKSLDLSLERDSLTVELPKAFLQHEDHSSYEVITSDSIQPVTLLYKHKVVTHSIAAIFVNTTCIPQMAQLNTKEREKILISELKKEHNMSKDKIKKYISQMTAD